MKGPNRWVTNAILSEPTCVSEGNRSGAPSLHNEGSGLPTLLLAGIDRRFGTSRKQRALGEARGRPPTISGENVFDFWTEKEFIEHLPAD
jgi:hypothetical protein